MTMAPRARNSAPTTASSVTTMTLATGAAAAAAATVSAAMARASCARYVPVRAARRDLASASTLTGITTDHATGAATAGEEAGSMDPILPRQRAARAGRSATSPPADPTSDARPLQYRA